MDSYLQGPVDKRQYRLKSLPCSNGWLHTANCNTPFSETITSYSILLNSAYFLKV